MQLTKQQARKLLQGKGVQLKHSQLGVDGLPSDMPSHMMKAIHRSMRQGKGMRMKFDKQHLVEGSGIFDWLKNIGQMILPGFKQISKIGAPIVKQFSQPIAAAISAKTGLPVSKEMVEGLTDVSSKIAGNGLRGVGRKSGVPPPRSVYKLADDYSTVMSPQHPVYGFQPQLPPPGDMTKALHPKTQTGMGIMFDSKQFVNPFSPVVPNYTAGSGFKLAGQGMKRAGSFRMT